MKKNWILLVVLVIMIANSACGNNFGQEQSESNPNRQEQPEDTQENGPSQNEPTAPDKTELDGQPIYFNEFPIPTADVFALIGEDADLYNAEISIYNPQTNAASFSEENTDLGLPAFEIYEKISDTDGNATYYGLFYKCDYYDLGRGLEDLSNPVYTLSAGKSPAVLTLDSKGNLVSYEETPESSNTPEDDIRRVCGPMTELADFFCGETDSYPKVPYKVPNMDAQTMVLQYLDFYFTAAN